MVRIRARAAGIIIGSAVAAAVIAVALGHIRQSGGLVDTRPWLDEALSPDRRAELLVGRMTLDEKLQLVHTRTGTHDPNNPPPQGPYDEVGYVPPIPRLGIPALHIDDGSLGVANAWNLRNNDEATALPSGLALAATWNPALAFAAGAVAGDEARRKGFDVLLAGSVNLLRDPHNGRAYEYAGEDPILAGTMVGETIRGIQSQGVVSTVKHFALNDRESGRWTLSAEIAEPALRESDLRAFEIAIERGDPGAVMCAYNKVNEVHACENAFLLDTVLREDWHYRGWVMSDWGAVHATRASAMAGLDQESGEEYDDAVYYGSALKQAVETGAVPVARLDQMVEHILRSLFAVHAFTPPPNGAPIDYAAHGETALRVAEEGTVLLKNDGALPLARTETSIAVIGSHADIGVLSGGGSSQVRPVGGPALIEPPPATMPKGTPQTEWFASSPLKAMRVEAPQAQIDYADGTDIAAAVTLAARARIAVVFAHQWMAEGADVPSLSLPDHQDALIAAVAAANPRTIVVLETGGPVLMPWLDRVAAVMEAWYPGQRGGEAIARLLFGTVDPSGRLPVSFPRSEAQLPPSAQATATPRQNIAYSEGARVGYRWYEAQRTTPLFPFGYGLTYTRFAASQLRIAHRKAVEASVTVTNTGERSGTDLVQLYVTLEGREGPAPRRLAGWKRVALGPGMARRVTITLDPHALKLWDEEREAWEGPMEPYRVTVAASASSDGLSATVAPKATVPAPLTNWVYSDRVSQAR